MAGVSLKIPPSTRVMSLPKHSSFPVGYGGTFPFVYRPALFTTHRLVCVPLELVHQEEPSNPTIRAVILPSYDLYLTPVYRLNYSNFSRRLLLLMPTIRPR